MVQQLNRLLGGLRRPVAIVRETTIEPVTQISLFLYLTRLSPCLTSHQLPHLSRRAAGIPKVASASSQILIMGPLATAISDPTTEKLSPLNLP